MKAVVSRASRAELVAPPMIAGQLGGVGVGLEVGTGVGNGLAVGAFVY